MKKFKDGDKVLVGPDKEAGTVVRRDDFEDGPGYLIELDAGGHSSVRPDSMSKAVDLSIYPITKHKKAEQFVEQPVEQQAEHSIEQPVEQQAEHPVEQPAEKKEFTNNKVYKLERIRPEGSSVIEGTIVELLKVVSEFKFDKVPKKVNSFVRSLNEMASNMGIDDTFALIK